MPLSTLKDVVPEFMIEDTNVMLTMFDEGT